VALRQRAQLDGVVRHERRLREVRLDQLAEEVVQQLALAHVFVHVETALLGSGEEVGAAFSVKVQPGVLGERVEKRHAPPRALQRDPLAVEARRLGRAVQVGSDFGNELLGQVHHPLVVPVRHVQLHHGKFRVVEARKALVAKVLRDFVDAFQPAHEQALEVQLVGNAQVERHVQRMVVGGERPRGGPPVDGLKGRRLDFEVAALVEKAAHRAQKLGALAKDLAHAGVHRQVDVAPAVAEVLVRHFVEDFRFALIGLFFLRRGHRAQRLREQLEFLGAHRHLAHVGAKDRPADPHDVADVEQLGEDLVVEALRHLVAADVDLDGTAFVLEVEKGGAAHHADVADPPGDAPAQFAVIVVAVLVLVERLQQAGGLRVGSEGVGVGRDAALFELAAFLAAALFLFAAHVWVGTCGGWE